MLPLNIVKGQLSVQLSVTLILTTPKCRRILCFLYTGFLLRSGYLSSTITFHTQATFYLLSLVTFYTLHVTSQNAAARSTPGSGHKRAVLTIVSITACSSTHVVSPTCDARTSAVATRGRADPPIRFRDRVRFSVD